VKVDLHQQGSVNVVTPRDALTEATLPELQAALGGNQSAAVRLVIDLTHVPFVDSAGIEYLLGLAGNGAAGALRPRLASLAETVREALVLTETLKRFVVFDTVEAAVRSYV
jgi:anti-anti-sigma factor